MPEEKLEKSGNETINENMDKRSYKILVYGLEHKKLIPPTEDVTTSNFTLVFKDYKTTSRFDDFDGIIFIQGIFKKDEDEFDKRTNELQLLINKSGFICFIVCQPPDIEIYDFLDSFVDSVFRVNPFGVRRTAIHTTQGEFKQFLDIYGAAYFSILPITGYADQIEVIAKLNDLIVGCIYHENIFIIPALLPNNFDEKILDYFKKLAEGLISYWNKRHETVPRWVDVFQIHNEPMLIENKTEMLEKITLIDSKLAKYKKYKRVLILDGDPLVEMIIHLLRDIFDFSIDDTDEKKEDLKILDKDGKVILLCEVKGTNKGVQRSHVYQPDSHRERANQPRKFPSILIINSHIRNSRTIIEKDKAVENEQVVLAVDHNVLILRTIDLLRFASLKLESKISTEEFLKLLTSESGWLKANDEGYEVISGKWLDDYK